MLYKNDWDQVKQRFDRFWKNENDDRCCLAVTAKKDYSDWFVYHDKYDINRFDDDDYDSIKHWWCDVEENVKRSEFIFQNTYYGAEALPISYTNWGAMAICSFLGSEPIFNKKSVWYDKVISDWETWEWSFDQTNNPYYNNTREITKALSDNAKGKYFSGLPELGSAGDILSLLRGMDSLCMDIYDHPDQMKQAITYITDLFLSLQDDLYEIVKPTNDGGGVLPWMSLWMPGKNGNQLACDFSWVISNDHFKEFFLAELLAEANWSDYATYHLDGSMCIKNHLETLLSIEQIKAIEFTPGAGSQPASYAEYLPAYKRIQQKGKQLILVAEPQEIDILTANLSPKGLFIITRTDTEEEANRLIDIAAKNGRKS